MKLARVEINGRARWGVVEGQRLRPAGGDPWTGLEPGQETLDLAGVRFLPPAEPTKIVCVAHNYKGLIEQIGEPRPKEPLIFLKPPSCLIGQGEAIVRPTWAERVIFEGELAVVMGARARSVSPEEALDKVLGYTCFNDVTEREMIERDRLALCPAKGIDTFGPCGPFLVQGVDPNDLTLMTWLNGRLVQEGHTGACLFPVERLISFISHQMTLFPGDIVSTGTPDGVAALLPGDLVEVEIQGLGRLSNPVIPNIS